MKNLRSELASHHRSTGLWYEKSCQIAAALSSESFQSDMDTAFSAAGYAMTVLVLVVLLGGIA